MVVISGDTGISAVQTGAVTFDDMPSGSVIQVANYTTGTRATGTATIPIDDTIPQISEGTQFMSLAFTPKKATSKLKITVVMVLENSNYTIATALFRDSASNAIASSVQTNTNNTYTTTHSFIAFVNAISTTQTTFTVRSGAGLGTTIFNGNNSGALLGGSLASSITIEEIAQ